LSRLSGLAGEGGKPAGGDEDKGVRGGSGAVKVGLGFGKAGGVGQPDREEGEEARAEDGNLGQDQDPHEEFAGEVAGGWLVVRLRLLLA